MIGKMLGKILRDWPWKLLSLGAAVLIWAAVSSEPEMATILRVPVEYKDGPANLEISSDIASTVRLELTGNSGRLKDFSTTPSPVVLDFGNVRVPGERTFNIDASAVRLPQGVQLIRSVPAQLRFVFEPLFIDRFLSSGWKSVADRSPHTWNFGPHPRSDRTIQAA